MDRQNKHLSGEDRGVIFAEHIRGSSQQMIGRLLGRPASTISRELARGRQDDGAYCPHAARVVYDERRKRCRRRRKLAEGSDLYRFVRNQRQHFLETLLYPKAGLLTLPAIVPGPVIFDAERDANVGAC